MISRGTLAYLKILTIGSWGLVKAHYKPQSLDQSTDVTSLGLGCEAEVPDIHDGLLYYFPRGSATPGFAIFLLCDPPLRHEVFIVA